MAAKRPDSMAVLGAVVKDIAAGIRTLRERDGIKLSEALVLERARNVTQVLVANFDLAPRDLRAPVLVALGDKVLRVDPHGADNLGHVSAATLRWYEVAAVTAELPTVEASRIVGALMRAGLGS